MEFFTAKKLVEKFGINIMTLNRWIARGAFPPPDKQPSKKTRLWLAETVRKWATEKPAVEPVAA